MGMVQGVLSATFSRLPLAKLKYGIFTRSAVLERVNMTIWNGTTMEKTQR